MKTCEIDGCENKSRARGWCNMHYTRWQAHGDPLKVKAVLEVREHEKWCPTCKDWVPKADFSMSSREKGGLQYQCRRCQSNKHLMRQYNLTREQWDQMLADQGGGCAICGTTEPRGHGKWHVDHDHACCPGEKSCGSCVRSLLCYGCNRGLGYFKDDPDRLLAAAAYLLSDSNTPTKREVPAV